MTDHARGPGHWMIIVCLAALLVAGGALGTYLVMSRVTSAPPVVDAATTHAEAPAEASRSREGNTGPGDDRAPLPDVEITLSEDAVTRAGIELAPAGTAATHSEVRIPGTVQPNAYRSVVVKPIVAGRVTRVLAELGQPVRPGQAIAEIYSPELAEAQARYLSSRAQLEAHEQALRRTERLVEIGAASRQELEKVHAEHAAATSMVTSNRARLTLLGMTDRQLSPDAPFTDINATATIVAPIEGTIATRDANVGLTVDSATPLFTVVDLSTVWIVGDLFEQDFARVRVGSRAVVTTTAYPDLSIPGSVSYIDPQVKPDTRTAQVRVEIPNRQRQLRLGMYAEMRVNGPAAGETPTVPRSAVQTVGDRSVVYVADAQRPGRFVERDVRVGDASGDQVAITRGLKTGDVVVVKGSFSLRAERERLGLRPPPTDSHSSPSIHNRPS